MLSRVGLRFTLSLIKSPTCHHYHITGKALKSQLHIPNQRMLSSRPPSTTRLPGSILAAHKTTFSDSWSRHRTTIAEQRSFSSSAIFSGPRSYYYGGSTTGSGSGGGGGGRKSGWRAKFDALSPNVILYSLIALNGGVFLLWQYSTSVYQQFRDPSWLRWMTNNFTSSWRNLSSGRVWTLLTCCFSHEGEWRSQLQGPIAAAARQLTFSLSQTQAPVTF